MGKNIDGVCSGCYDRIICNKGDEAMKRLFSLLILLLVPLMALAEDKELSVGITLEGPVVGFDINTIKIDPPFSGMATLRVQDDLNTYCTMTMRRVSHGGNNEGHWDGLGDNDQRLPTGKLTLSVEVTAEDGRKAYGELPIQVAKPEQAVIFALSNADKLYLDHADEWAVEVKMVRAGKLCVDICTDLAEPGDVSPLPRTYLDKRTVKLQGTKIYTYTWDGKIDGEPVEPGEYMLRFYAEETPEYTHSVVVRVEAEKPDVSIGITDRIVPDRGMSDEEIWQIMMQPSIVLDVRNTRDYEVRSEPGKNGGKVVGTIHGQSQGLMLLEITQNGYAKIGAWRHEDGAYMEGYVEASKLKLVEPKSDHALLLDKAEQTLSVFYEGERIGTIPISTGLVAKGKLIRETAAGAFLLQEHMGDFSEGGYTYSCVIRYDGGNLLHQVGYKKKGDRADFSDQEGMLGVKASHGCVRMPFDAVPYEGYNAYWLWTHMSANTRLIILDDEEQRTWEAQAVTDKVTDAQPEAPKPLAEGESELLLTFGGDAVLGTREKWWNDDISFPSYLARNGMAYPFSGLQSFFAADDMTFINLECVLKADSAGEDKSKEYRFRGLPEYTQILAEGSVELVNIANNHYIDYGTAGRDATRQALENAGMPYSGYGYTYVWEQDGHKIGFAGCRETTYKSDKNVIRRDVAALRRAGCDVVIYSCHWGKEYRATHNALQEEIAREAMLAGVDIIVGAHPHVVQGLGTAGNTVVIWSLGNLMFGGTHDMTTFDATLCQVRLRFSGDEYVGCTVGYIPILTSSDDPVNDFHPVIAEGEDKARILKKIQDDTSFPLADEMYFPAK